MIGIPQITRYGSSFGTYGGNQLKDYSNPEPNGSELNNKDMVTTGEYRPFQQTIKDFVLARLGHPTIRVELTDFQLQTCIDEAITKLEYFAPQWMTQYAVFYTSANVNVYELPPAIVNNLADVWYRKNLLSLGASPGSLEYDLAVMFFTNTGLFNNYNVGQYLLMQMYLKQVNNVLGLGTTWNIINNKHLQLFPVPDSSEGVILEFRGIDAETIHPAYKNWLQRYSLCVAKEILGRVRSKFKVLPGPAGGSTLDGQELSSEAREEKALLLEELQSEMQGPPLFSIF